MNGNEIDDYTNGFEEIMKAWMKALKSLPQKSLSRRSLLGAGPAAGAAVPSLARVASAAGRGPMMAVRVENIHITTNVLPAPSATFFLTIGIITEVDGIPASGSFTVEACLQILSRLDFLTSCLDHLWLV